MAEPDEIEVPRRRGVGIHPVLLVAFILLLVLLAIDVSGVVTPPEGGAPTARRGVAQATPTGVVVESHPLPLDPSASPEEAPSSAPSASSKPSPAPRVAATPAAAPSSTPSVAPSPSPTKEVERPQEIEVQVPRETPSEVEVATSVVGPPDGARVGGEGGRVTLGWPPGGAARWHVEVRAQGRPWVARDVTVPSVTLEVSPGPTYQWRVTGGERGEVIPWRTFQYVEKPAVDFRGREGAAGRGGGSHGEAGEKGGDGADGDDTDVWVEQVDGYIRVRVETWRGLRETLWVAPGGAAVRVRAGGGDGGTGGAGAPGEAAVIATRQGYVAASSNGGSGGPGGNGGNGGTVRLHGAPDLARYVDIDVSGGAAGAGGPGATGSTAVPGAAPGSAGRAGASGTAGRSGRVERVP